MMATKAARARRQVNLFMVKITMFLVAFLID